jgi:hypothetical protein
VDRQGNHIHPHAYSKLSQHVPYSSSFERYYSIPIRPNQT